MDPETVPTVRRAVHGGNGTGDLLDFSANTNPRCPDGAETVYREAFESARSYPVEPPDAFEAAAAEFLDCEASQVLGTAGGIEAIRLAIETTVEPGDTVLVPAPSFSEYAREVRLQGATPSFVRYDELLAASPEDHALVIACHPNNPTGDAYDDDRLRDFAGHCRKAKTPLLVDEAFLGFTDRPTTAGLEGVIVARSLTKLFGLPGLRAGYLVANGEYLRSLSAARSPWNLSAPARAVGTYCFQQSEFVKETRNRVNSERTRMRDRLSTRFAVYPSESPFLLLNVGDRDVSGMVETLRQRGVLVRDATSFRELASHVRVAVRLPEENDRLLEALDDV